MQKINDQAIHVYTAEGAIAANRVVIKGTAYPQVKQGDVAGTARPFGVSRHAAADTERVDVYLDNAGIVEIEASATFAYGAQLTYDNAGKVKAVSAATEHIIGLAEEACTAIGQLVGVRLQTPVLNT